MSDAHILDKIITAKRDEVADLRRRRTEEDLRARAADMPPTRGFLAELRRKTQETGRTGLIAEIKKASPSKGIIREDFDPAWLAGRYEEGGAACLSILTDEQFFLGKIRYLHDVYNTVPLPLLRKDFIIDRIQLYESRIAHADAILLIAACLAPGHLVELHEEARNLGLDVLVEIHERSEWDNLISAGLKPALVGINNRDLRDFSVTLETTVQLAAPVLQAGAFLVAESGISTAADVEFVARAGAGAVLVGESLMRQDDPGQAARELIGQPV